MMNILVIYSDPQLASYWMGKKIDKHVANESTCSVMAKYFYPMTVNVSGFTDTGESDFNYYDFRTYRGDETLSFDQAILITNDTFAVMPEEDWVQGIPDRSVLVISDQTQISPVWESIKYKRALEIASGFTWEGNVYQTGLQDIINILGRVTNILAHQALSLVHPNFTWRDINDDDHEFTPTEFLQFAIAMDAYVDAKYKESWTS